MLSHKKFYRISPILKSLHCLWITHTHTDTQTLTTTHRVYACKCVSIVYTYMCFKIVVFCGYFAFVPCYVDWHNSTACGFIYGTFKHRSSSFTPWYQSRQCDVKWWYSPSSGNKEQAFGSHGPASSQQGTSQPKDNGEWICFIFTRSLTWICLKFLWSSFGINGFTCKTLQ